MTLITASLNSGSNGNCYFVGNGNEAVLVDAGISCREIEKRLLRMKLSIRSVKAIFISHEHTDHISGVAVLSKKYQLPVYITPSTLQNSRLQLDTALVRSFVAEERITIGGLSVTAFKKFHDASEPHSFVIAGNEVKVGVFTDIGIACERVIHYFKQCHVAFLEANYDEDMLRNGSYPYHLKRRISSDHGHLSNTQALDLFKQYKPEFMSLLFLSHLSRDNNSPQLVHELFTSHAGNTHVVVASRHEETEVFTVNNIRTVTGNSKQLALTL